MNKKTNFMLCVYLQIFCCLSACSFAIADSCEDHCDGYSDAQRYSDCVRFCRMGFGVTVPRETDTRRTKNPRQAPPAPGIDIVGDGSDDSKVVNEPRNKDTRDTKNPIVKNPNSEGFRKCARLCNGMVSDDARENCIKKCGEWNE